VVATFGTGGAGDDASALPVTWYPLTSRRLVDDVATTVHRRFRDFAELDAAVRRRRST
jgi:hypothetical protein